MQSAHVLCNRLAANLLGCIFFTQCSIVISQQGCSAVAGALQVCRWSVWALSKDADRWRTADVPSRSAR